jgi:hypothetical protein
MTTEISELPTRHGFELIQIETGHILFPYKINEYVRGRLVKEAFFGARPNDMFQALGKRFGWHPLVTARVATTSG